MKFMVSFCSLLLIILLINPVYSRSEEFNPATGSLDFSGIQITKVLHDNIVLGTSAPMLPMPFFQSTSPVCFGTEVCFTDLSVAASPPFGFINTWRWNFGDGSSEMLITFPEDPNVCHLYATGDTFAVTLTIQDNYGYLSSFTRDVIVHPLSEGGIISGNTSVFFGQSTGSMGLYENTGTPVAWQKQYNGGTFVDIPGTSGMTAYTEVPVYTGTWNYRAVVQSGNCSSEFSSPATVVVNTPMGEAKTWTGTLSDNWNDPENWSPKGIPVSMDNLIIPPSAPFMPKVSINGLNCSDLILQSNSTLTILPGYTLTINGQMVIE